MLDPDHFPTEQTLQQHLVAKFVPAVYQPDRIGPPRTASNRARRGWSNEQAGRYLTYLANHLHRAGTRDLAWWQLRDTIPRPRRTLILATIDALIAMLTLGLLREPRSLSFALTEGVVTLLASGLTVAVTAGLASPRLHNLPRLLTSRATFGLGTGLIITLIMGLQRVLLVCVLQGGVPLPEFRPVIVSAILYGGMYGCVSGAASGLVGPRRAGPQPTRTRAQLRGRSHVLAGSYAAWFIAGFTVWIVAMMLNALDHQRFVIPRDLAFGALLGGVVGLAAVLVYGFETPLNEAEIVSPVESLARDRGNSLRKSLAAGLAGGSTLVLMAPPLLVAQYTLVFVISVVVGWVFVRPTSAWLYWLVFARGWLPLTGRLPWRVQAFLTDAHHRGVLRQTGGVYQFRHATLQDHLTTETPSQTATAGT